LKTLQPIILMFLAFFAQGQLLVPANGQKGNKEDITPLGEVRLLSKDLSVTVSGRVTASANEFADFNYIQDKTGGMRVQGDFGFSVGDSVVFFGITSLMFDEPVLLLDSLHLPLKYDHRLVEPKVIDLAEIQNYKGQLVRLKEVELTDKNFVFLPNANESFRQNRSRGIIRIWWKTRIAGHVRPQHIFDLTGVVGQYRNQFQIYPRNFSDIKPIGDIPVLPAGIPKEYTFDLTTWNLEWFGNPSLGPADEELQFKNVRNVLKEMDADVFVLEEISSLETFNRLVLEMPGYEGQCSPAISERGEEGFTQQVCFLYKKQTVTPVSIKPILGKTPPVADYPGGADKFWAAGRLPALFVCDLNIDGNNQRIHILGIHAKANRNTTPEERILAYQMRKRDIEILKDTLDMYYGNLPIIVAGDFNDDVDETVVTGFKESTYSNFAADTTNWRILTAELSKAGHKSYIGYDNVIDHVMVSDELFSIVLEGETQLQLPFLTIDAYPETTSDHLPVLARFKAGAHYGAFLILSEESLELKELLEAPEIQKVNVKLTNCPETSVLWKRTLKKKKLETKLNRKLNRFSESVCFLEITIADFQKKYRLV
jgi:endonuclease/exonuclease/phosphatase family metal-dependent hydrolase